MAKAKRVTGIRPRRSLAENAPRILNGRLDELLSFHTALNEPALVTELHGMRIAAKRLRYSVEVFEVCNPHTKPVLKSLSDLQEQVGAIHDLDVLIVLLRDRLAGLGPDEVAEAKAIAAGGASTEEQSARLRETLRDRAEEPERLGLLGLIGGKLVERDQRYGELRERWTPVRLGELANQIRALSEPAATAGEAEMTREEAL